MPLVLNNIVKSWYVFKYSLLTNKVFIQSKKNTIHAINPLFPIIFPFLRCLLTCYIAKEKENLSIQYIFMIFEWLVLVVVYHQLG